MSVGNLALKEPTAAQATHRAIKVHGSAEVAFCHKNNETTLGRLYYTDPLKVLFPRGDVQTAALITTGGGLFGGDKYDIKISLEEQAEALVTAQAAEKVYRSSGPDCEIDIHLEVADGASLEWLPQETILFDLARFRRRTKLEINANARALVGEIIVFGRLASGEEIQDGFLREAWDVRKNGKTIWSDALLIEGDFKRCLDHISGFGGARAIATSIYAGPDAETLVEDARAFLNNNPDVRMGASLVNGVLICRWLAKDPYALRKAFGGFWAKFRNKALGRSENLPRLWHC